MSMSNNQKTKQKTPAKAAKKPVKATAAKKTPAKGRKKKAEKDPVNKKLKIILAVLIVLVVIAAAGVGVRYLLELGEDEHTGTPEFEDPIDTDDPEVDDEVQVDMLRELRSSGDLFTLLKDWSTNTTEHSLMQSRDVTNVLIVGLDASGGNSDVMMLASVNTAQKKIYLTSFMRDSYTYMKTPSGETATKLNAAYANGGMSCLIDTLENDYKIKIDHYVSVNFNTFVTLVDLIGGVKVPVQQYEMRAMNSLAERYDERLNEYGDSVLLTGRQALLYCRIRKCDVDGDVSRTRRQRQFISALVNQSSELTVGDLPELVKTAHKYVKTDCSVTEIVSLATKALTGKWYNYELVSNSFPAPENRMDYSGKAWVWIVDYPADAVALHKLIYGDTNVRLSEDRRTAMDIVRSGGI